MSSRHKNSDGDWICSSATCSNLNFARRTTCNRCGRERESVSDSKRKKQGIEIGKAAAEKSHGLFSADDWQCSKCGNVNWARRQTCNMCNAPKVGELEERTGYGGGFNEREGVEYIKREESDDEYDEFGMKKKKFRGQQPSVPSVNEPSAAAPKTQDDDDDEDDDDEGGDLSKYDLWNDDDDADVEGKDDVKSKAQDDEEKNSATEDHRSSQKGTSRSRSKSRSYSRSNSRSRSSSRSSRSSSYSRGRSRSSRSRSRSPWSKSHRRDRSRSRDENRRNRSFASNSSYSSSRSRSRSRSRSDSKDKKFSRR